jgi:hypothetical protein
MTIEWVPYNRSIALSAGVAAENFRIDPIAPDYQPKRNMSPAEVREDAMGLLSKPQWKRTFIIGPFTNKIDSILGRMQDEDINFIEAIHRFYEERGIEA